MVSTSSVASAAPSLPHPALWRASQISPGQGRCIDTGHAGLSAELPGGGWPCGELIELMPARAGIGELRLLQPALAALPSPGSIALVQPPHMPQASGWAAWHLEVARLLWVCPQTPADALWATDQLLKSGTCAAVLCWLPQVHANALRRLHAAAQGSNVLFVALRPWLAVQQPSPAPLRLQLQPHPQGLQVHIVKRRGPARDTPLQVSLYGPATSTFSVSHAFMDSHTSLPAEPRRAAAYAG